MTNYTALAKESRLKVLELVYLAQTSHIGSLLGCADIFAVLFSHIDFDKDRFVLSAGWKAAMLYFHLWKKDRITLEELDSYCQPGSKFIGLAENVTPDIPIAGGSMGIGLPGAVGLALAKKIKGEDGIVYVLMSDGELQCGTTWESALIAAQHKLDNLVVIVDMNGFQAMGKTKDILDAYFPSKGWRYSMVDGHDCGALQVRINRNYFNGETGPSVIFAETIKGKGVSFIEGDNLYHYKQLSQDEYERAKLELHG